MGSSMDHGVSFRRARTIVLLALGAGMAMVLALVLHTASASASGATPTIDVVNAGNPVAATGAKTIIPITGTNFASPKVTITGDTGKVKVLGLAAGTTSTQLNVIVHLPGTNAAAGTKVVTVKNHKAGSTTSSLTVDAAPVITSIETSSLFKGGTESITVTGTHFHNGASLLPAPDVKWSNVTRVSSTEITATATVKAKPSGTKRVIQVSNPDDGGYSTSVASSSNRMLFVDLPVVTGYFYFGQGSPTTGVSITGLPTSSGTITSLSFGESATASFDTAAWNASPSDTLDGTLSFGETATLGNRALNLSFSSGLTITSPRALFITPAPTLSGYADSAPHAFPLTVNYPSQATWVKLVGSGFMATTKSGLVPTASVSGTADGVSIGATFGTHHDQTTAFIDPAHLGVTVTSTTCTPGTDDLTITNPSQLGTAHVPGIVGGSVTIPDAIAVTCLPEVSSISPAQIPASGDPFSMTIHGSHFEAGDTVYSSSPDVTFADNLVVVSDTEITVDVSSTTPAVTDIGVANPDGTQSVVNATFTVSHMPTISSFTPGSASTTQLPVTITIHGTGFQSGAVAAASPQSGTATLGTPTVVSSTEITVPVTAITNSGDVYLSVTNPDGGAVQDTTSFFVGTAPTITEASLSATPLLGTSLSVNDTETGDAAPTVTYQWYRCNSPVTEVLSGATPPSECGVLSGQTSADYTPSSLTLNKYVTVMVTATNDVATAKAIAASPELTNYPPSVSNPAVLTNNGETIGSTVMAGGAIAVGYPAATIDYQWYDCPSYLLDPIVDSSTPATGCVAIDRATGSSYVIQGADAGSYLAFSITGSNGITPDLAGFSSSSDLIYGPVGISSISVTGTPADGSTLTATFDTYGQPAVTGELYQWYLCPSPVTGTLSGGSPIDCAAISGANSATYTVDGATDAGQYLVFDVSVSGGTTGAEGYSASTDIVTWPPGITGFNVAAVAVGDVLTPTADTIGYPAPVVTYSWYTCTSQPSDTLSVGSGGVASYLSGSDCTLVSASNTDSTFDTASLSPGDILVAVATATQGSTTTSAVTAVVVQSP